MGTLRTGIIGVILATTVGVGLYFFMTGRVIPTATATPSGMATAPPATADSRVAVQLDARRQQLTGVRLVAVERTALQRDLRAVGIVRYDETRLTDVNLRLDGWVRKLYVDYTGQPIRRGQPLLALYSPDLLAAEQEYLLALSTKDTMAESQVVDARDQASRLVDSARQRLAVWDLPPTELRRLDETRKADGIVTFPAPVNGHVIEKPVIEGMHVTAGQTLYKVADLSTVWVEGDFYESDSPFVRVNAPARVTVDAWPGDRLSGRVVYVYPFVDDKTRTTKVRFAFPNPLLRLKPGMFANVELQASLGTGLTVPEDAVLDSGREQHVFVADGDGYFTPRLVHTGQHLEGRVQILDGLAEGDKVAAGATFFLDSESQLHAAASAWQDAPRPAAAGGHSHAGASIVLRTNPDPARVGETAFEVTLTGADGSPVGDADVSLVLFMPSMPSMNMPAMRAQARLAQAAPGLYRGQSAIPMSGRWDVTITAARGGAPIATSNATLVVK